MENPVEVRLPLGVLAPTAGPSCIAQDERTPCDAESTRRLQRIAVCGATGLLAVANGRVIDLYHAEAIHVATPMRGGDTAPPAIANDAHLPFAGQIVLGDHLEACINEEPDAGVAAVHATCVAFVAPGFLLVAATNSLLSSSWLCGFRMYIRSVAIAHHRRPGSSSLLVHCAFADHVPNIHAVATMDAIPSTAFTTREAGAVTLLFSEPSSSCFGVFQWAERFSDRALSIAHLPQETCSPAFSTVAISCDARWMALADERGTIHVLDFTRFVWQLDQSLDAQSLNAAAIGKRLTLDASYRMGRDSPRDHPLEGVRLVSQAHAGAIGTFGTTLRWWRSQLVTRSRLYLLMGQTDGAMAVMVLTREPSKYGEQGYALKTLEVYPAIRSLKNDALVLVSEPDYCEASSQYRFSTISQTSWRHWAVGLKCMGNNEKLRLEWPTLQDSLGLRTLQFERQQAYGCLLLPPSSVVASRLTAAASSHFSLSTPPMWLLILTREELRAIAYPDRNAVEKASSVVRESDTETRVQSVNAGAVMDTPAAPMVSSVPTPVPDTRPSVTITLQDRYKLPAKREGSLHTGPPPDFPASTNQRLTKDEYNWRLAAMAQRVDRLHTNLHTLRTSFQLFTSDVQQHMMFISHQLEEIQERQHEGA